MAITVECSCGKRLKVRDEHAGKRAKCPACGQVLVLPQSGVQVAEPAGRFDAAAVVRSVAARHGRKDVLEGIPPKQLAKARTAFASEMGPAETPLAFFPDHRGGAGREGILITDRQVYGSRLPAPLSLWRLKTISVDQELDGMKLRVNGIAALVRKKIDPMSSDLLPALRSAAEGAQEPADLRQRYERLGNPQHVAAAARAVSEGKKPAAIEDELRLAGADEASAKALAAAMRLTAEPGAKKVGRLLVIVGVVTLVVGVGYALAEVFGPPDPAGRLEFVVLGIWMPVGAVIALIGLALGGIGVAILSAARKRLRDATELAIKWQAYIGL